MEMAGAVEILTILGGIGGVVATFAQTSYKARLEKEEKESEAQKLALDSAHKQLAALVARVETAERETRRVEQHSAEEIARLAKDAAEFERRSLAERSEMKAATAELKGQANGHDREISAMRKDIEHMSRTMDEMRDDVKILVRRTPTLTTEGGP